MSRAAEASVLGRRGLPLAGPRRRAPPAPWLASFAFSRLRAAPPFPDAPAEIVEPQWLLEDVALDEPSAEEPPPERALPDAPPMAGAAGAPRAAQMPGRLAASSRRAEQPQAAPPAAVHPAARPSAGGEPATPVAPEEERTASLPSPRTEPPPGRMGRPSSSVIAPRSSTESAVSGMKPSRHSMQRDEAVRGPMQLDQAVAERGAGAPLDTAVALPGAKATAATTTPTSERAKGTAPMPPIRQPVDTEMPRPSAHTTMPMGAPPAAPARKAVVSPSTAGAAATHREGVEARTAAPEPPRGVRIGTVQVVIRPDPVRAPAGAPAPRPNSNTPARAPAARPFRSPWISWRRGD